MRTKKLFRTWYSTDVNEDDPEYVGTHSGPLPDPSCNGWEIVDVDWSVRGEVQVTFLVPND